MLVRILGDCARTIGYPSTTLLGSAPETVAAKTRQRVLDAIDQVGYIPNSIAGSLAASRSQVIGVLVPTITNSILDRKSTRLTSSHVAISYDVFSLKKKKTERNEST